MKKIIILLMTILLLLLAAAVLAQGSGSYSLPRFHTSSGGALSGGTYTMLTSAGQAEAGVMQGKGYTMGGGFWGGGAVREISYEIFLPTVTTSK